MNDLLKELLPNPTFVDYQVPHTGQGADFYNEQRMIEYGRRVVQECVDYLNTAVDVRTQAEQQVCVAAAEGLKNYFELHSD